MIRTAPNPPPPTADEFAVAREVARAADDEKSLIGATLLLGFVPSAAATLAPADFVRHEHGILWQLIQARAAESPAFDAGMVLVGADVESRLRLAGLDLPRAREILLTCAQLVETGTGADVYAKAVREHAARRRVERSAQRARTLLADGASAADALEALREAVRREELERPVSGDAEAVGHRTATELLAEADADPEEFFWNGIVGPGLVTLFAGAAKAGKSWLFSAFASALASGRGWLGAEERAPVPVLYVTEEGRRTTKWRARKFGLGDHVHVVTLADLPAEWGWPRAVEAVLALAVRLGCRLVIIDTVLNLARLPPEAAYDDGAVRTALAPVVRGAAEHGLAMLLGHHLRKGGGAGGDAIFGANAFRSVPDVLVEMGLERGEDDPERKLRVRGRTEEGAGVLVVRHVEGCDGPDGYELVGSPADAKAARAESAVLSVLANEDGWLATGALLKRVGQQKAATLAAIKKLAAAGRIRAREAGRGLAFGHLGVADDAPVYRSQADEAADGEGNRTGGEA